MNFAKKHKFIVSIIILIILIPITFCVINTIFDAYATSKDNEAYEIIQKVVDKNNYQADDLASIHHTNDLFTIYSYTSSFSNSYTISKNRRLYKRAGIKYKFAIHTPYYYSVVASQKSNGWNVIIKEEPFGPEKIYHMK